MRLLLMIWFWSISLALDYCSKTILIESQNDVDRIKDCTEIKGSILVKAHNSPVSLSLLQLRSIQGSFIITGTQITTISLPLLTKINQDLYFTSIYDLQHVNIPSLTDAYSLQICNISATVSINFKAGLKIKQFTMTDTRISAIKGLILDSAQFDLQISNNPLLTSLDLSHVTKVDQSLIFRDNPLLDTALFPNLVEIGHNILFKGNTKLSKLDLSKLERVANKLEIISPSLTELDLGSYRISSGCKLIAPLDCEKFRSIYAISFNYGECLKQREAHLSRQLASDSNRLNPLFNIPLITILISLLSILML